LSLRSRSLRRALTGCSAAAALLILGVASLRPVAADGETRTISLHHVHTNEDLTVTYKRNGRYDEEALQKISNLLRDWRQQEPTKMDPEVIDLLWEVHHEVGAKDPIWVVCGYRSPETNAMLRSRSSGVAKFSQHMLGKAIDFFIPNVPLEDIQAAGLRSQRGGVGIYPGSHFVHLDTGSVRHWPRMPEAQLAKVLARGPLNSHTASDNGRVTVAQASTARQPSLLARLFGAGKDEDDEVETASATAAPAKTAPRAAAPARTTKPVMAASDPRDKDKSVPLPQARPAKQETFQVASAESRPVIARAGLFPSLTPKAKTPEAAEAPAEAAQPAAAGGFQMASAASTPVRLAQATSTGRASDANRSGDTTASAAPWPINNRKGDETPANAMAYAAQPTPLAAARTAPMGTGLPRPGAPDTTIAVKRGNDQPSSVVPPKTKGTNVVRVGDRFNDPWMRAMIVSPSAQSYMWVSLFATPDFSNFGELVQKPVATMAMSFTQDPHFGMTTEKFTGNAVFFLSTSAFGGRTASLK
jgi:uncharacterized protein YcbK (DUF882 family)